MYDGDQSGAAPSRTTTNAQPAHLLTRRELAAVKRWREDEVSLKDCARRLKIAQITVKRTLDGALPTAERQRRPELDSDYLVSKPPPPPLLAGDKLLDRLKAGLR